MLFRIYRYEFSKLITKKYMLVAFFVTVVGFLVSILYFQQQDGMTVGDYNKAKGWEGPITAQVQERFNQLQSKPDEIPYSVIQAFGYVQSYQDELKSVSAALNADKPGTYTYQVDALHKEKLQEVGSPEIRYTGIWDHIFMVMEEQGFLYIGALLVLGVSPVFASEFATNLYGILRSTKHGRRKLVTAKIGAAVTYSALIGVGFVTLNVGLYGLIYGFHGYDVGLHNLRLYVFTPYNFPIWEYVLVQYGLCVLGCVGFGLIISLLSLLTRSPMVTVFVAYTLFFLPLFVNSSVGANVHWVEILCKFSYTYVIQVTPLIERFDVMDWFGKPVLPLHVVVVTQLTLMVACIAVLYQRFGRSEAV